MPPPHNIMFLAFDGFELLDITGPSSVFASANRLSNRKAYDIRVVSLDGGLVASSSGVEIATRPIDEHSSRTGGTLLVAGGSRQSMDRIVNHPRIRQWLARKANACDRTGSVCSGTYVLAKAGLLSGRSVATHWANAELLASHFPDVRVDAEALYAVDGRIWTSAGVTTGIDMALAMVESDIGSCVADATAKFLVLYMRRPAFQSQFSSLLTTRTDAGGRFVELTNWMLSHLAGRLDVHTLAGRAGLSERTFYRYFQRETGRTPAQFVEDLRVDAACALMAAGLPLKTIAGKTGFGTRARLSSAFTRRFGVPPSHFHERQPMPRRAPSVEPSSRARRKIVAG